MKIIADLITSVVAAGSSAAGERGERKASSRTYSQHLMSLVTAGSWQEVICVSDMEQHLFTGDPLLSELTAVL